LFGSNWLQKISAVESVEGSAEMSLFGVFCVLCSEPETSAEARSRISKYQALGHEQQNVRQLVQ
jgi:hypothetical protein